MWGSDLARVLRSEKQGVKDDDIIRVLELHEHLGLVFRNVDLVQAVKNEANLPLSPYISILGIHGSAAYYGFEVIGKPKTGETIHISSGAGAVGATVSQLVKLARLKVIASAGFDEKVQYLKSIGVDVAFNYKQDNISDVLKKKGPIDIYWNNVGGESLQAAINASNSFAHIIMCSTIPAINGQEPYAIQTELCGPDVFEKKMILLIVSGKITWREHTYEGLEQAGQAIRGVLKGDNRGKYMIKVAYP